MLICMHFLDEPTERGLKHQICRLQMTVIMCWESLTGAFRCCWMFRTGFRQLQPALFRRTFRRVAIHVRIDKVEQGGDDRVPFRILRSLRINKCTECVVNEVGREYSRQF